MVKVTFIHLNAWDPCLKRYAGFVKVQHDKFSLYIHRYFDFQPYLSIESHGLYKTINWLLHVSFKQFHWYYWNSTWENFSKKKKILENSYFRPYWPLIKPRLHRAVIRIYEATHKPFHRFFRNSNWGNFTNLHLNCPFVNELLKL
jgi:hypothetical protein